MKQLCLACMLCLFHSFLFAQSQSIEVDYQKQSRPAIVNDLPFDAKTVENAIDDTLSKMGYKGSGSKGFTVYKGDRKSVV